MKQRANKKTRKQQQQNVLRVPHHQSIVPRGMGLPSESVVNVGFSEFVNLNYAGTFFAYILNSNAPYDVDPAVGSTATQIHSEMSAFYQLCRVLSYTVEVDFQNYGVIPTEVTVLHTNLANGVSAGGSAVDLTAYDFNRFAQRRFLGHAYSGNAGCTIKSTHSIASIVGSATPITDDNYASSVGAVPSDRTYILIGAKAASGSLTVWVRVRLQMQVKYYDRKVLST